MAKYGVQETNGLGCNFSQTEYATAKRKVAWNDDGLEKITRLRLLSDPGFPFWDVSYCFGRMKDGEVVEVGVPFSQLSKRRLYSEIVDYAKKDKVYAKGLGVFDAISKLC